MEDAGAFILSLGANPWTIALAIVLATFVLEDATTIAAALLAADGVIAPGFALAALFTGIFAGDLGLYGLGAAARSRNWAHRMIGERNIARGRSWLQRHFISAVVGARFLPGFRLPTYTASGFLGLSFWKFASISALAGLAWTSIIFSLVYFFGTMFADTLKMWRWPVAIALIALSFGAPMLAEHLIGRKLKSPPPEE
ncbi:MAG: VTT domain-containing protein [Alphaproteobacteria bacterium]|nr:VTT domain-containing protein [Alphaproteobacteria bacterium]